MIFVSTDVHRGVHGGHHGNWTLVFVNGIDLT